MATNPPAEPADPAQIEAALSDVRGRLETSTEKARVAGVYTAQPRLVAVSKTKPLEDILAAYGEVY